MIRSAPLPVKHDLETILGEAGAGGSSFKVFLAALEMAGVDERLRRNGPFTLFVPTDDAFSNLAESTSEDWLRRQTKPKLRAILSYHVLQGRMLANEIIKSSTVRTIQGSGLTIRFTKSRMYVNNALVLRADIAWDNGVIHVLDTVVIPR